MDRGLVMRVYRLGFAALTLVAIVAVAADLQSRGRFDPVNFFSYFTIQSNLIATAVFVVGAAGRRSVPSPGWQLLRGQAVLVMTVTLVVFALLLAGTEVDVTLPWVDTVVHRIMPLAVIADWLIDPPPRRIPFRTSLIWLTYPLLYAAYTTIRGAITGWYPYPFLDPANGGYASVAAYIAAILVFGIALCGVIAWVGNVMGGRRQEGTEAVA
jgi:hypothetical protein